MMRKAMRTLGAGLVVVVLGACAVSPPNSATTQASATPTPAETGSSALTATGNVPELLDTSYLDGLLTGVGSVSTSAASDVFVSWPQFSRTVIDQKTSEYFNGLATGFEQTYTSDKAEINVTWRLIGSSPTMVGIISDGYLNAGADGGSFWHSIWSDPTSDVVLSNADLVNISAANTALAAVGSQQSADIDGFNLGQLDTDPASSARLLAFTKSGELVFGYDECQIAACSAGRVTLTIDKTTTASLLTARGQQAQTASIKPTAAVSVSTPTPTVTASPSSTVTTSPTSTVNCAKAKCIALTFDDGPGPYTTKLLGYLSERKAPATFFMLGQQVEIYPKVAKQVAAAGNQIGVHTWSHRQLTRLTTKQIDSELSSTVQIINKEAGVTPTVMRPPYGSTNSTVSARAKAAGLAIVLWNVDTLDWKTRSTEKTVAAALADTRRGSIILVHDIHKTTVAAVPGIIDGLRAKGYTFVTVDQLLGKTTPGKVYRHG